MADRLEPPPFWRTPYFEYEAMARPDRRDIDIADIQRALIRPWPADATKPDAVGGEDAGDDLVIHYAPDGEPWLWEIEHASEHPEHIVAALDQIRLRSKLAA